MSAPVGAPRCAWIGLAVLALPCVLYAMDLTVLNLALPRLASSLHPTGSQLLWILDVYGFLVAGSLITMGSLGDRIGRRRLLLIGAATFGLTSILAAFANSAPMLIAARALLGLSGATIAPSTLSLIRNLFERPAQRSFAIGVWIASYSAGSAIGPLVGGLVLERFWPGAVFLLGVPAMLLLLVLGPRLLPESKDPDPGPVEWKSAALSLGAVLMVVYGVKRMAADGIAPRHALAIVAGLVIAVLFVRRQSRLARPFVDLSLFRIPAFSASLAGYAMGTFVIFGSYVEIAQHLQLVLGLSPLRAGLATLPFALAFIMGSMATPRLARRVRPVTLIAIGLLCASLGFIVLARIDSQSGVAPIVVAFILFSLGVSPIFTLASELIVSSAPPERAGVAAAISETGSELGGALGIAILGSIGTAVFRHRMADTSAMSSDSLEASLALTKEMSPQEGARLVEAAHEAFVASLRVTSTVGAAVLLVMAIVGFGVAVRGSRATREPPGPTPDLCQRRSRAAG